VAEAPIKPAEGLSLSRWSRLKREQRAVNSPPPGAEGLGARVSDGPSTSFAPSPLPQPSLPGGTVNLELPPLSSISLAEDFTPFMQAKVPQILKQQALKALFKDPHFNTMDGLDIYIDDYTVFEPISAEDMGKLSAWKSIQNPLKQVVTPGGYAVDVESEEGRAVLAEQARVEALAIQTNSENIALENRERLPDLDANGQAPETLARERERGPDMAGDGVLNESATQTDNANPPHAHPDPLPLAGAGLNVAATMAPPLVVTPLAHPRYGKRVSDFKFIDIAPETDSAASSNIHKKTAEKPQ
jgi:Protein of unknown function (DUF3306)